MRTSAYRASRRSGPAGNWNRSAATAFGGNIAASFAAVLWWDERCPEAVCSALHNEARPTTQTANIWILAC
jgi:hypothetical protein